jgi:hypothetical protein
MLQYQRNPARCHCTTVSGLTKMSASFQEDQRRRASSQKGLSAAASFGRGCLRLRTLNCCRSFQVLGEEPSTGTKAAQDQTQPEAEHGQCSYQIGACGRTDNLLISWTDRILANHSTNHAA